MQLVHLRGAKCPRSHEVTSVFRRVLPIRGAPEDGRLQCRLLHRMSLKEVRGWCSWLQRAGPAESRERMRFQEGPNQSESSEGPPVCSGLVMGCVDLRHGATLLISRLAGRDATQAMISPASNKARSQVKPA